MRPLLIIALAATLVGCACFTPQQAQQASLTGCNGFACSDGAAGTVQPLVLHGDSIAKPKKVLAAKKENAPHRRKTNTHTKNEKSNNVPKMDADPLMKKAKTTIAAKMEIPASVEFVEMNRAYRKDARGNSIDTICGYVRGKTTLGGETGDRPFLYLVQEDEAYIGVYILTSAYRDICN